MTFRSIISLAAAMLLSASAQAHEYKLGDLQITHPYARVTAAKQPAGAAYLTIENKGKDADKLLSAASPVANEVQIHSMSMDGNVMKMREVGSVELKPAATVSMKPGDGYHIMLIGLKQPLKAGDKFPLTLTFEKAGKTEVSVHVEQPKEPREAGAHRH